MAKISKKKIINYISGNEITSTPEEVEVEAIQTFTRQLVEDCGYEKDQIQTHPQFRVKARLADEKFQEIRN